MKLANIPAWLMAFLVQPREHTEPEPNPPRPPPAERSNDPRINYVLSGFEKELEVLAQTRPGGQSHQLNASAFNVGTLVGTGLLSQQEAEAALLAVALKLECLPDRERWTISNSLPQIRSGLSAGMREPRRLPEPAAQVALQPVKLRRANTKQEIKTRIMRVQQPQSNAEYENIPEGEYQAVLCEVLDLGWQMNEYQGKKKGMGPRVQAVFQINCPMADGRLFQIRSAKMFINWWDPQEPGKQKSGWVKFLYELFGANQARQIVADALEKGEFDEKILLGANALIETVQKPFTGTDGTTRTFDNIASITRWSERMGEKMEPKEYTSATKSERWTEPAHSSFEDFPGDIMTGEVHPDHRTPSDPQPAASTPPPPPTQAPAATPPAGLVAATMSAPAPAAPPTAAAPPPPPPAPVGNGATPEQLQEITAQANRVWGEQGYEEKLKTCIGDIAQLNAADADGWIAWFKPQPDRDPFEDQ